MQKKAFTEEYKTLKSKKQLNHESRFLTLNPFIDKDNRANTRLKYAEYLSYDARFPIILPRGMWVNKLIVRSYHIKDGHSAGTNHTLANLSRFWLMQGREEIPQEEKECSTCKICKAQAPRQVMAPLPQI